jgi:glycerol uptake facilitator protein
MLRCVAELLGTYLLIFFGCGAVHAAVLTGAQAGLWQVAIVWGVAVMLAVYCFGGISGAHINPAITVALAVWGKFAWRGVALYAAAQLCGAFLAAATLFLFYGGFIVELENRKGVVRGQRGSEITAMCYGEYFPSPGPLAAGTEPYSAAAHDRLNERVSEPQAVLIETIGTLLLALAVFALTDERNAAAPAARLAPVFIGLAVAVLISVMGPLTQACLNPARDFGPRLFACLAGWGTIALPRGTGFLTVYIVAPTVGAVLGGGLYTRLLRPAQPEPSPDTPSQP